MAKNIRQKQEEIHEGLASLFAKWLVEGRDHVTEDGTVVKAQISAAHAQAIRAYLKDNKITGIPQADTPLGELVALARSKGIPRGAKGGPYRFPAKAG